MSIQRFGCHDQEWNRNKGSVKVTTTSMWIRLCETAELICCAFVCCSRFLCCVEFAFALYVLISVFQGFSRFIASGSSCTLYICTPRTIYDARPNSTTRSTGIRGRALSLHSSFIFTSNEQCTLCTVWMCDILGHRYTLDISSFDIRYINVLLALLNLIDIAFFVHT